MLKLFQVNYVKHYCDKHHILTACLSREDIQDQAYIDSEVTCDKCQEIIDLQYKPTYDGYLRCVTCQYDLCKKCAARPPKSGLQV